MKRLQIVIICWFLAISAAVCAAGSYDPVAVYLSELDSLLRSAPEDSLRIFVEEHSSLNGAAVGVLIDEAVAATGASADAKFVLADRMARIHLDHAGSALPLDLVSRYRSWTQAERAVRNRAKTLDGNATQAYNANRFDQAVDLYHQARTLYESIGDRRSLAILWGSLGKAHWYRNDMDSVRASYDRALPLRRAIEDRILEGRTLNGLGSVSFQKGLYREAIEFYNQAVELRRQTGDIEGLITSLSYRGATYTRLGELMAARTSFEEALPLFGTVGSLMQKIEIHNNLGNLYKDMGRLKSSAQSYREAIRYAVEANDPLREASARINMADDLRGSCRFRESLRQLEAAQDALQRSPDPEQSALLHKTRGLSYMSMGELDKAREDLTLFLSESERLQNPSYHVEGLIDLGYLYRELGAFENGLRSVLKAKERAEQLGDERMVREALFVASDIETKLGRYENALQYAEQALSIDRRGGFREKTLEDLLSIATIISYQGNVQAGRAAFQETRTFASELGREDAQWAVYFGIAHSYERENPDSSLVYYEKALEGIERVGSGVGGEEIESGFFSNERRRYYEEVTRFYASQRSGEPRSAWSARAFQTIERAKSRGLLELLERSVVRNTSAEEDALIDSLYAIKATDPGNRELLRSLESRYIALREDRLRKELGELGAGERIARIELVQEALPEKTVLLEYALGDTVSLLWAVDDEDYALYELPARSVLQQKIQRLRDAVAKPGSGDETLKRTARELFDILIKPAGGAISGMRRLILVPDGILFDLPFELLLASDPPSEGDWGAYDWLTGTYETVYFPSASIFLELQSAGCSGAFDIELLAVGNPDFSTLDAPTAPAALPYTQTEVEAIGAFLDAKQRMILTGREANETGVKRQIQAASQRVLHLATHGYADPAEPVSSSILLSRDNGSADDGYLHTLEIISLPLTSNLVVLSACESARGQLSRGEGVIGLSRAFFAAGSKGVVASLWSVSDKSTAALMNHFYQRMFEKNKPARTALREARLSLMKEKAYAHPFYWSPFVIIGSFDTPWSK